MQENDPKSNNKKSVTEKIKLEIVDDAFESEIKKNAGPIIQNYEERVNRDGKKFKKSVTAQSCAKEIISVTSGWPKRVGCRLFIERDEKIRFFDRPGELLPWVMNFAEVDWRENGGMVTKTELFHFLCQNVERFESVSTFPYFPPEKCIYSSYQLKVDFKPGVLDEFLNFFNPATPHDKDLIKALIASCFWSNPGGKKPLFIICAEDDDEKGGRGVGKTALTDAIGKLCGGVIDSPVNLEAEKLRARLLQMSDRRLVRFDNVKASKLSTADIEMLITSEEVTGHALYIGSQTIANRFTYVMTFNDPNLSKDLAQRSVIIKLKRPPMASDWWENLCDFCNKYRDDLIAEIGQQFLKPVEIPFVDYRFSLWAREILSRCGSVNDLICTITDRGEAIDGDDEDSELMAEIIEENLNRYKIPYGMNSKELSAYDENTCIILSKRIAAQFIAQKSNLNTREIRSFCKQIERAKLPFICADTYENGGQKYYLIFKQALQSSSRDLRFSEAFQIRHHWSDLTEKCKIIKFR